MASTDVPWTARPGLLRMALLVVLLEVLALLVGGAVLFVEAIRGDAQQVAATAATAVFAWVLAGLLALAGRALWRLRRWGRGPLVTWQVLQGAVGLAQLAAAPVLGGLVVAVAVLGLVGLLAPSSTTAIAAGAERSH